MDQVTVARATVEQVLGALEGVGDSWRLIGPAIHALRAALQQPNECLWLQDGDEDSGTYMASCNRRYFMFEDGTPTDNRMSHCCYCGKRLVEVPIEPEDNHD